MKRIHDFLNLGPQGFFLGGGVFLIVFLGRRGSQNGVRGSAQRQGNIWGVNDPTLVTRTYVPAVLTLWSLFYP